MADGTVHYLPPRPLHVREQAPEGVHFAEAERAERYDLRAWVHGYAIYDRGELICTFHGPQFDLASKVMRSLREEDAQNMVRSMLASCPEVTPPGAA